MELTPTAQGVLVLMTIIGLPKDLHNVTIVPQRGFSIFWTILRKLVKGPVDHQFLKYLDQHLWHQKPDRKLILSSSKMLLASKCLNALSRPCDWLISFIRVFITWQVSVDSK